MISVYKYRDPARFLRNAFLVKKCQYRRFSYRSLCMKLGIRSHSFCKQIFKGERRIPSAMVARFAAALGIDSPAAEYLQTLVCLRYARSDFERKLAEERLLMLSTVCLTAGIME